MQAAQLSVHAAIEERHGWFLGSCGTGGNIEALARDYACAVFFHVLR